MVARGAAAVGAFASARLSARARLLALLALTLFGLAGFGLLHGAALWRLLNSTTSADSEIGWLILRELRLPRVLLGILIGATLGMSGALLQGLLRNPLADPGVIGASSGAALGAVIALYFGLSTVSALALPLSGFTGALAALLFLFALAGRDASVLRLILAGVAINALAGALSALALNLAPSPYAALEIAFWLLGSLADRSMQHLYLAAPIIVAGCALMLGAGRMLDALTLGEDVATSLGVYTGAAKTRALVGAALALGAAVAVSGSIAFVGLIVPHLLRPRVGHLPSALLVPSALGGAVLVLAADLIVQLFPAGPELKLGVLTALIGAPFFLHLIVKSRASLLA